MTARRLIWTAVLLLITGAPAAADVIHLHTGGVIKGDIVSENRREVVVRTPGGTTTSIARLDISHIERGASPEAMYEKRLAEIDRSDPEAHYALGLWLKSIRCDELAEKEFLATVALDPDHRFARYELGHVKRNGEWVPRSSLEPPPGAEAEAAAGERQPRVSLKGASRALSQAVVDLRDAETAEDRATVWGVLLDEEAEAQRLLAALTGEGRAHEGAWRALTRAVPEAEGLDPAAVDAAELEPLAARYVAEVVRPGVDEALVTYGRWIDRRWSRIERDLERLMGDYRPDDPGKRADLLADWAAARDEALRVIFDKKIYPDENHGRVGQPTVDEKVAFVRAAWSRLDPAVTQDTARLLALATADARALLAQARGLQARYAELRERQRARRLEPVEVPALAPVHLALLAYRAEEGPAVAEVMGELSPYETLLLTRLRNERVEAYNAAFARGNPHPYGAQPTGEEIEQVRITNEYRRMMGRLALEIDPRLIASARGHSQDMTRLGFFAHDSPIAEKKTPFMRMAKEGYPGAGGENISLGSEAPQATHDAWYNSSGHHRNILAAGWTAMGSGQDGRHWTQNFGSAATLER